MNGLARAALAAGIALLLHASIAAAQAANSAPTGRFEVSAGGGWIGPSSMGSRQATLTSPSGGAFRLFSTSTDLASSPELHVRVADRVARAVHVEVGASFSRPDVRTTVTDDAEMSGSTVASVSVMQFALEGGVRISPAGWLVGRRTRLFMAAGGGYLRQLYEGKTLVETGSVAYAGGGVTLPFSRSLAGSAGSSDRVGLRIDLRAVRFSGGVALDGSSRIVPLVTASVFARF